MEKEKILIIDDDDDILRVVRYNLEKIGYNVIISENGDDGFEKIKSANPDLVLIDFIIPGISGIEILTRTKQMYPDMSVIFMTAYGSQEIAVKALKSGADDYVVKPFIPEKLVLLIKRIIADKKVKKENEKLMMQLEKKEKTIQKIKSQMPYIHNVEYFTEDSVQTEISTDTLRLAQVIIDKYNNPLSILSGYMHLLNENRQDKPEKVLEKMDFIVEKMKNITRDLEIFTISKESIFFELINVNFIIDEILGLFDDEIQKDEAKFTKKLDNTIPKITGDRRLLHHVFYHLIENALCFSGKNGIVSIITKTENSNVCIEISDNGQGIRKNELQKIFNPFFTTKPIGQGLGLGLSIVKNIIEAHNGFIKVKSTPDIGSTFTIVLPAVK